MIIGNRINTHINVNISRFCTLIIVSILIFKKTTNLKNTFYVDKEIQDSMKEFYQIKRNLIIQHNFTNFLEDYNRYRAEIFRVY